jgi:hypothetical protein
MAVRFYLNAGLFETMTDKKGNTQISVNRQLRDVLRSKGYEVLHEEFAGGHSPVNWRGTFADGLIFLMHGAAIAGMDCRFPEQSHSAGLAREFARAYFRTGALGVEILVAPSHLLPPKWN